MSPDGNSDLLGSNDDHGKWQVRGKQTKIFFYSFSELFERTLKQRV